MVVVRSGLMMVVEMKMRHKMGEELGVVSSFVLRVSVVMREGLVSCFGYCRGRPRWRCGY